MSGNPNTKATQMTSNNITIKNYWFHVGDDVTIIIVRRDGSVHSVLVSHDDFYERIAHMNVSWCVSPHRDTNYAYAKLYDGQPKGARGGGKTIYMHRVAAGIAPDDLREVDHVNANGLDNRRSNLQIVTKSQNQQRRRLTSRPSITNGSTGLRNVSLHSSGSYAVSVAGTYHGCYTDLSAANKVASRARAAENTRRAAMLFRPVSSIDTRLGVMSIGR